MDVQFSGAVDFAPLFSKTNPLSPAKLADVSQLQSEMLQSQNAILRPLNQEALPWMTGSFDVGTTINIWA
jgi:hypothetical protein